MTARQIFLVKRSWKIIGKIDPVLVGDVFYSKLFVEYPELRSLFKIGREAQSKKLLNMLTVIVTGLDRMDTLISEIEQLGKRHKKYGVATWQYSKVGEALQWTLEQALGRDFDTDTRQAWLLCYSELSLVMMHGAQS